MPTITTKMVPEGKLQSPKSWRHMMRHQCTPLHPVLEARKVPPYHPLGSIHKRRKNPLCAILKYLPIVCGSLRTRRGQRRHIEHMLIQRSVRGWRRGEYSKTKVHSKSSLYHYSNLSHVMSTYTPPPRERRMCMTWCHQELSFRRTCLTMSYSWILRKKTWLPSNRKQSCCNGTTVWDTYR